MQSDTLLQCIQRTIPLCEMQLNTSHDLSANKAWFVWVLSVLWCPAHCGWVWLGYDECIKCGIGSSWIHISLQPNTFELQTHTTFEVIPIFQRKAKWLFCRTTIRGFICPLSATWLWECIIHYQLIPGIARVGQRSQSSLNVLPHRVFNINKLHTLERGTNALTIIWIERWGL